MSQIFFVSPRRRMSGRKQDEVWRCFDRKLVGTGYHGVCKGCKKDMAGLVKRMIEHADACPPLHAKVLLGVMMVGSLLFLSRS